MERILKEETTAARAPGFAIALALTVVTASAVRLSMDLDAFRPTALVLPATQALSLGDEKNELRYAGNRRNSEPDFDRNELPESLDEIVITSSEALPSVRTPAVATPEEEAAAAKSSGITAGRFRQDGPSDHSELPDSGRDIRIEADKLADREAAREGQALQLAGQFAQSFDDPSNDDSGLRSAKKADQIGFYPSSGYWANTHIPGDPAMRLLHSRLSAWDRSAILSSGGLSLEQRVRPVDQPLDAPSGHALALSLMADRTAIQAGDGAQRVTLQVGIRAVEHRRGQRPAMNLAVVIDLPPNSHDARRIEARALVDALIAARQPGDRFSVVFTDGTQGFVVGAHEFRFGTVQEIRQAILGTPAGSGTRPLDLTTALALAGEVLLEGGSEDTPDSEPLGTRSTLLVTAASLGDVGALAHATHDRAVKGLQLSVLPLGERPEQSAVEQLVLAGLGHRRALEAPAEARSVIEDELHAASKAVARAARLSIRLSPGVNLIDIVGSRPLDQQHAQRVRDVEQHMDRLLSQHSGIRSDRGEDEEGIQIVVPTIDAGDEVVVLLELAVARPGPLADVSLRYKDLVYLRNARLDGVETLASGIAQDGPAERMVRKNRLAHDFSSAARRAGEALSTGNLALTAQVLERMQYTLLQARHSTPAWSHDPELINDEQVLSQYLDVLSQVEHGDQTAEPIELLADSLRFAAWAKTHQPISP